VLRENKAEGESLVAEGRRLAQDEGLRGQVAEGAANFPRFAAFAKFVADRERLPGSLRPTEAAIGAFGLLDRHSLFACEGEVDDDGPLR
jgi:hypothetical protein